MRWQPTTADAPAKRRRRPQRLRAKRKPELTVAQILQWADAHFERTGRWPRATDGRIRQALDETWAAVDAALFQGCRGLTAGSSLARFLSEHRGVRNRKALPPYTLEQILVWADDHHSPSGRWPNADSGPVVAAPGETWAAVEQALRMGLRGMPGGSSLAQELAKHRGVRNIHDLPRLSVSQILAWADAHHERSGDWPTIGTGPIPEAPGESWQAINLSLRRGSRGLPGGRSLPQLLHERRNVRHPLSLPRYTVRQIVAWADAHRERTGGWPTLHSGPIPESPGDTWGSVDAALANGCRGLRGGTTLARLLAARRGVRNKRGLPPLSIAQILAWANLYYLHTGRWPKRASGPIPDSPGDSWQAVNLSLLRGYRGLPGGESLAQLLERTHGVRNRGSLPPFTEHQILEWADSHYQRRGCWPTRTSGPILDDPRDKWQAVDQALVHGLRGLAGGSSLARLLHERRGARHQRMLAPLRVSRIRAWARAYRRRFGRWPSRKSGAVAESPGETWPAIDTALGRGHRGLPGGSSLAKLLKRR